MAVINCINCGNKISDKAKLCPHCNIDLLLLNADKIAHLKKVNLIEKSQRLMTHSFIAMLLFCGGFLVLYWQNLQIGTWQYTACVGTTALGFCWYIITRIRLLMLKRLR